MRRALAALHRVDLQRTARRVAPMAAAHGAAPAPPPGFVHVGALAAVPEGLSEAELREGVRVVLVRRAGGALHALGGECPHRQGQMAVGDIEEAAASAAADAGASGGGGGSACCVICPRHRKRFEGGLRFDVDTGRSFLVAGAAPCDEFDPSWRLPVHDVITRNGDVFVSSAARPLDGAAPAAAPTAAAAAAVGSGSGAGSVAGAGADAGAGIAAVSEQRSEWLLEGSTHMRKDVRLLFVRQRRGGADAAVKGVVALAAAEAVVSREVVATASAAASSLAGGAAVSGPWHVRLSLSPEPGSLARDYTPLSSLAEFGEGRATLLVKIYPHGALTRRLGELALGSSLFLSPPLRTPESYKMQVRFEADALAAGSGGAPRDDVLLLVCGGSGITPVLQMARWALEGRPDAAPLPFAAVLVLTSMRNEVICRKELAALARRHARMRVLHTLTAGAPPAESLADEQAPARVDFAVGRISTAHVRQLLAGAGGGDGKLRVLISGPPGFAASVEQAVRDASGGGKAAAEISAIDTVSL